MLLVAVPLGGGGGGGGGGSEVLLVAGPLGSVSATAERIASFIDGGENTDEQSREKCAGAVAISISACHDSTFT